MSTPNDNASDFERPIRELEAKIRELVELQQSSSGRVDLTPEIEALRHRASSMAREIFSNLTPWQRVTLARRSDRPMTSDYISLMTTEFVELHGDRSFADDRAIITGLATIGRHRVMLIGHQKGKTTRERALCHWGCPFPEGYRKALLKMKLAERLGLPIVTLIDTPGAHCGIGAEERGQAQAIALNLHEMSALRVPIVSTVIGEGGSGGAIAIGLADRFLMLENAYFSVISPEGCAAILWKTADRREDAANALKLTAKDLRELGIVDEIIPEPLGGAHRDPQAAAAALKEAISRNLDALVTLSVKELLEQRCQKHRRIGAYLSAP